ncbi:MAG: serine/threonine protein kinase, partial [Anaerolineales bacterium]|nr:serine/threonine protein kinase [Anaerolineales bacterium]
GRYRLLEKIGSGGMSLVYKAQDTALGRLVAVKVLHESLTGDPTFLERFRREAHAAASLSHPNVVTVHDVGQDGNRHYIVMELVQGDDLKNIIRKKAPLSLDLALDLAIQICRGVGYAHRSGFVHCDVKPQNVLVTGENRAMVADFGIARVISEATMSRSDIAWGTPHYFSPEQAAGEKATPASDVYAIGVILFEMLTGRLPFIAETPTALALKHIREDAPFVTDLNPDIPIQVAKIISKVLSKEPSARYRTADQFGRILEKFQESSFQSTSALPAVDPLLTRPAPLSLEQSTQEPAPAGGDLSDSVPELEMEDDSLDWISIFLGAVAVLTILGLVPLWIYVYQAYKGPLSALDFLPIIFFSFRSIFGIIY